MLEFFLRPKNREKEELDTCGLGVRVIRGGSIPFPFFNSAAGLAAG